MSGLGKKVRDVQINGEIETGRHRETKRDRNESRKTKGK